MGLSEAALSALSSVEGSDLKSRNDKDVSFALETTQKNAAVWVFAGPTPAAMQQYHGDQADLLVRYLFTLTPQEQAALTGRTPSAGNISKGSESASSRAAGKQSGGK